MDKQLQFKPLQAHPESIPQLASWFHQMWSYLNPGQTLDNRIDSLKSRLNDCSLPQTYVVFKDDELVGSASLVVCDMKTRPQYTPWLASVYVKASARKQGIGQAMLTRFLDEYAEQYPHIYLFTPDQAAWYAKMGWQLIEETNYRNTPVSVMRFSF